MPVCLCVNVSVCIFVVTNQKPNQMCSQMCSLLLCVVYVLCMCVIDCVRHCIHNNSNVYRTQYSYRYKRTSLSL